LVARQLYDPWGNVRYGGGLPTDISFTGQRSDATGLIYFKARHYDSALDRFLSADTLVPDGKNPQQFNRYSYGLNNPVKYTDPSGHKVVCGATPDGCEDPWAGHPPQQPYPEGTMDNVVNFTVGLYAAVVTVVVAAPAIVEGAIAGAETAMLKATVACVNSAICATLFGLGGAAGAEAARQAETETTGGLESGSLMQEGVVYRGGSATASNLTPRPGIDTTGLSTYDSLERAVGPGGKAQMIDVSKLQSLSAIRDLLPLGHVTITRGNVDAVEEWAATRGTEIVHAWTQEIMDAIIGEVRRPK
jgi:RHS repeat-associated protein